MNITGIVVEYNPFHQGHSYHIKKSKALTNSDFVVAVMSGNFVQRGAPALIDKWSRTKMALMNGVDLVLELPLIYSLSSAEFFAYGSISLLNSLGITKNICFGSECGNINLLFYIAKILSEEPIKFRNFLRENLKKGFSYPHARNNALLQFIENFNKLDFSYEAIESALNSPNNILGIEYCKSLIKLNSNISPYTIKREGGTYKSTTLNEIFSSASSIRKYIKNNANIEGLINHIPKNIYELLLNLNKQNYHFTFENEMLPYLKYKYTLYKNSIEKLPDVSEGIHNRIYRALDISQNFDELLYLCKTKRYTYTRISRILCQFFIGFENWDILNLRKISCPYARVLGFNSSGSKILRKAKQNTSIPIYTKLPKQLSNTLQLDVQGTKVYSLINNSIRYNEDYLTGPIIMN